MRAGNTAASVSTPNLQAEHAGGRVWVGVGSHRRPPRQGTLRTAGLSWLLCPRRTSKQHASRPARAPAQHGVQALRGCGGRDVAEPDAWGGVCRVAIPIQVAHEPLVGGSALLVHQPEGPQVDGCLLGGPVLDHQPAITCRWWGVGGRHRECEHWEPRVWHQSWCIAVQSQAGGSIWHIRPASRAQNRSSLSQLGSTRLAATAVLGPRTCQVCHLLVLQRLKGSDRLLCRAVVHKGIHAAGEGDHVVNGAKPAGRKAWRGQGRKQEVGGAEGEGSEPAGGSRMPACHSC